MNWRSISLVSTTVRLLLLGAVSGIWGTIGGQIEAVFPPSPYNSMISILGLGLGIGLILGGMWDFLHGLGRRGLVNAAMGGVFGATGAGLAGFFLLLSGLQNNGDISGQPPGTNIIPEALILGVIASFSLIPSGYITKNYKLALRRAVFGLILGFFWGLLVAYLSHYTTGLLSKMVLLSVWGMGVCASLYGGEKKFSKRWLRLLTGRGEDMLFPLNGSHVSLGKHQDNDIPLQGYNEIFPYHCHIRKGGGKSYEIVDDEQGGVVYVNFRPVKTQTLKPGDLIKIGSALLQYGEKG